MCFIRSGDQTAARSARPPHLRPMPTNLERMMALVETVFAARTDPDQLQVDERVIAQLRRMHPATMGENDDGHGPVAWLLLLPTTTALMRAFVHGELSEKDLYERTPGQGPYGVHYLCSALVLPEYRRKGITRRLMVDALTRIQQDEPISALCVWPFTEGGRQAARALARETGLPLFERPA